MNAVAERRDRGCTGWELPHEFRQMQRHGPPLHARARWSRPRSQLPHDAYALPDDVLKPLQEEAKKLGFWHVESPAEWGGAGLNLLGQAVVAEEASQCKMGALHRGLPRLRLGPAERDLPRPQGPDREVRGADDRERRQDLRRHLRAERRLRSRPRDPDPRREEGRPLRPQRHQDVDLRRRPIELGPRVRAHRPSKGRDGITSFIVEKKFKGFSYKPIPVIRSYFPYEISFQDCEVPEENRLGNEGEGFKLAETWLVHARIPYAAAVIGVAQAALQLAIDWAKQRETFGSTLADKQAIQWMIAD